MRPPRWLRIRSGCRTDTPFGREVQVSVSIDEEWGSPGPLEPPAAEAKPHAELPPGLAEALQAAETFLANTEATTDTADVHVDSDDRFATWRYGESHHAMARREAGVLSRLAAATEASDDPWAAALAMFGGER